MSSPGTDIAYAATGPGDGCASAHVTFPRYLAPVDVILRLLTLAFSEAGPLKAQFSLCGVRSANARAIRYPGTDLQHAATAIILRASGTELMYAAIAISRRASGTELQYGGTSVCEGPTGEGVRAQA
eukprot:381922-Rhodomonas_salina.7